MYYIKKVFFTLIAFIAFEHLMAQCPTVTVTDGIFCGVSTANVAASNGSGTCPYRWYNSPTGGTPLETGCNFTTPILTCDQTFYVEDTSSIVNFTAGYSFGIAPLVGPGIPAAFFPANTTVTTFNTTEPIIINSLTVRFNQRTFTCAGVEYLGIQLDAADGTTTVFNFEPGCGSSTVTLTLPVNFSVPVGNGHQLRIIGAKELAFYYPNGADYSLGGDLDYPEGLRIISNGNGGTTYGGFFDWDVTIDNSCTRMAVQAIQTCTPVEICNNGIDDDCDGLIDCWDGECNTNTVCDNFYFGQPTPECQEVPVVDPNFGLTEVWQSSEQVETRGTPIVGDIDGDGIPEVISHFRDPNTLYVFDGLTGSLEVTLNAELSEFSQSPGIADTDGDGLGEIYAVQQDARLHCFENDGAPKAGFTNSPVGSGINGSATENTYSPAFADFDEDGQTEVYIANQIFDALTGAIIAQTADPVNDPRGATNLHAFSAAWDILPDGFCTDCSGAELICGNTVYSVNLTSGILSPVSIAPTSADTRDGKVSLADWNGDGLMDIIVSSLCCGTGGAIYIWDPRTQSLLTQDANGNPLINNPIDPQPAASTQVGLASIADFDGDGLLELAMAGNNQYIVIDNDMTIKWTLPVVDASNLTSSTAFDFEGDGVSEIIYRDEDNLFILDGATGAIRAQTPCGSHTRTENPIIADVNGDGDAEILCTCFGTGNGRVIVFESNTNTWVNTRRVWHQHNYTPVYVNDDLTIPRSFRNKAVVPNQDIYLAQSPIVDTMGEPIFAGLPDLEVSIDSIIFADCTDPTGTAYATICNTDLNTLVYGYDVSYYNGDPLAGGTLIGTTPITNTSTSVVASNCIQVALAIPNANYDLHVFVNDNGSNPSGAPVITLQECDSTNNGANSTVNCNLVCVPPSATPVIMPSGPITVCGVVNETLRSSPELGYYFSWYRDGIQVTTPTLNDSVFVATTAGEYTVRVADDPLNINDVSCYLESGEIEIIVTLPPVASLGNDTAICQGDSLTLDAGNAGATYLWSTGETTQTITVNTSGSVDVMVDNGVGCLSHDTLSVTVLANPAISLGNDTVVCQGDSLMLDAGNVGATYLWSTGETTQTIIVNTSGSVSVIVGAGLSCSAADTIVVTVLTNPIVNLGNDTTICAGDSIRLDANNAGAVFLWNTTEITQAITVDTSGNYEVLVTDINGCQGRDSLNFLVIPFPVVMLGNDTTLCQGDTLLLDAGNPGAPYLWSTGEVTQQIEVMTSGSFDVIVGAGLTCSATDTIIITVNTSPIVDLGNDTTICQGDSIMLDAGNAGAAYLWNTGETTQTIATNSSGIHVVTVQDPITGCLTPDTLTLSISTPTAVTITSGNSDVCLGSASIDLTIAPLGGIVSGLGVVGDQFNPNSAALVVDQVNVITYTLIDSYGCISSDSTEITVRTVPRAQQLIQDTTICAGNAATLSVTSSGATSLEWFMVGNGTALQTGSDYVINTPGEYYVLASNAWCSSLSDTTLVNNLTPSVTALADPIRVEEGETTTLFIETPVNNQNYTWSTTPIGAPGDGDTTTSFNVAPT